MRRWEKSCLQGKRLKFGKRDEESFHGNEGSKESLNIRKLCETACRLPPGRAVPSSSLSVVRATDPGEKTSSDTTDKIHLINLEYINGPS